MAENHDNQLVFMDEAFFNERNGGSGAIHQELKTRRDNELEDVKGREDM